MMDIQKYKITYKNLDVEGILTLRLEPLEGGIFDFKPGQFAFLHFLDKNGESLQKRTYSITTSPLNKEYLEFGIKVRKEFSNALLDRYEVGDVIGVQGPFGKFVYDEEEIGDFAYYAGGIGITPFMSMIRYLHDVRDSRLSSKKDQRLKTKNEINLKIQKLKVAPETKVHLFYSVTKLEMLAFGEELVRMEEELDWFSMTLSVTDPIQDTSDKLQKRNKLQKSNIENTNTQYLIPKASDIVYDFITEPVIKKSLSNLQDYHHFLCGPLPFMDAMKEVLKKNGVEDENVRWERFVESNN